MTDFSKRLERRKINSMLYWYPKIAGLAPTPQTDFIDLPQDVVSWLNDGLPKDFAARLDTAAKKFGFPLFMRTDQMAAKHSWKDTCYVDSPDRLSIQCLHLLEENYMLDMAGECSPSTIALREFLQLEVVFHAFNGMPVAREFRIFAKDGEPLCVHPYWPPESIRFFHGTAEPPDWRTKLANISKEPRGVDAVTLGGLAMQITEKLGGYWSVDCCKNRTGVWYVTDMACGFDSFHWPDCKAALKESA